MRGATVAGQMSDPAIGDYMGMLATQINALALKDGLIRGGCPAEAVGPHAIPNVCHIYDRPQVMNWLTNGTVVVFGGGTGHPFLTTDTAAAMRGAEIEASAVLKGSNVDGIYDADPRKNPDAKRFDHLSFDDAIAGRYAVMDQTAFAICRDRNVAIRVFNMTRPGAIADALSDNPPGTLVGYSETMSLDDILLETEEHFDKSLNALDNEFKRIRTGQASPQMIDHVQVEAYGAMTPLNQVAGVSVPEPQQLLIKPWDKTVLHAIEKALIASGLGMAPQNDGDVIRLNVPPLSEERRKELASQARDAAERCKVGMRNSRRDGIKSAEAEGKSEKLPEDAVKKVVEDISSLLKDYEAKAEVALLKRLTPSLPFDVAIRIMKKRAQ